MNVIENLEQKKCILVIIVTKFYVVIILILNMKFLDVKLIANEYEIKAIPLNKIIQYELYEGIINERNTLKILDHPFLMKQVKSLKTKNLYFFLNKYIRGKVLSKFLKEENYLNKNRIQLLLKPKKKFISFYL